MATATTQKVKPEQKANGIFDPVKYYTVFIYLHNATHDGKRVIQIVKQTAARLDEWSKTIYISGIRQPCKEDGIIDIIAPFSISHVAICPQVDEKTPATMPQMTE